MGQGWFTELSEFFFFFFFEKAQSMSYAAWCVCAWGSAFLQDKKILSVQTVTYSLRGNFSKDSQKTYVQDRERAVAIFH